MTGDFRTRALPQTDGKQRESGILCEGDFRGCFWSVVSPTRGLSHLRCFGGVGWGSSKEHSELLRCCPPGDQATLFTQPSVLCKLTASESWYRMVPTKLNRHRKKHLKETHQKGYDVLGIWGNIYFCLHLFPYFPNMYKDVYFLSLEIMFLNTYM